MIKLKKLLPTIFNPTSNCECGGIHKRCDCEIIKESYVWERKFGEPLPKISFKEEPISDITVNEVDFSKIKLPSAVDRFLNRFVDAMKSAQLNRMKRAAILYKVIDAAGMTIPQLMADIQKIKKELK